MHKKIAALLVSALSVTATACGPKQVSLAAEPASAVLYKVGATPTDTTRLGVRSAVKLVSEHSYIAKSAKDDEAFQAWSRILLRYKDVINEIQERLK